MLEDFFNYDRSTPVWELEIFPYVLVFLIFCIAVILFKLARSVHTTESGKVIVQYHSPTTWLKRFDAQVTDNRAGYSDRQKKILSFMVRGKDATQAFGALLLGLVLSGAGLIVIVDDPTQIKNVTILAFLGVGIVFLAIGYWLFTQIGADDPYR